MTRSHVLLHCANARLRCRARRGVGKQKPGKHPSPPVQPQVGTAPVKIPRTVWSGKGGGRRDGRGPGAGGEDGSVDCVGSGREGGGSGRGLRPNLTSFSFPFLSCSGGLIPRALRTAHAEGGGSLLLWRRPRASTGFLFPLCYRRSCMAGLHIPLG